MLNSVMIDVALGMVFIFLMLSLVCAAVREAIEARLKMRSKFVAYGIAQLLQNPNNASLFYQHPTIQALYEGRLSAKDLRYLSDPPLQGAFRWIPGLLMSLKVKTNLPSYIPSRAFALTLLQLASSEHLFPAGDQGAEAVERAAGAPNTITLVKEALAEHPNSPLAQAMSAALITAGNDVDKAVDGLSAWFDASMDRVSGWYKRETQHILFWVGLTIAVALNIDTLFLMKYLSSNGTARDTIVAQAQKTVLNEDFRKKIQALRTKEAEIRVKKAEIEASNRSGGTTQPEKGNPAGTKDPDLAKKEAEAAQLRKSIEEDDKAINQTIRDLADLNLPIGWNRERWNAFNFWSMDFVWTLLGWFVTAFGLSFGAPFWFDVLNKIMVIRSTVKPHEKSAEEASEDRQRPPPAPAAAASPTPAPAPAPASTGPH